jgi:UDP-N-acetylglucosamine 2-epimerase (non-hydrolysing)
MKIAPLVRACVKHSGVRFTLIHTGQHYDKNMSDTFFEQLGIPQPDINLNVGGGSHATQTGYTMIAFEKFLQENKTDCVIVVGDVNATLACAVTAKKQHIPVAHIESGLRSFDRSMPEEINRLATDAISDFLYTPSPDADKQLKKEGVHENRICCIGNVMIDTLIHNLDAAEKSQLLPSLNLKPKSYALLTLHRPSNVDDKTTLEGILNALKHVSLEFPIVFPVHPRTKKQIETFGLEKEFNLDQSGTTNIITLEPVGYLEMLQLTKNANIVLTDSGGLQEETTVLGVPCLTLRPNTERPITISEGSNTLVGTNTEDIIESFEKKKNTHSDRKPALWDGNAADRFLSDILTRLD